MTRIFTQTFALVAALLITSATFAEATRVPASQGALISTQLA
ncbi:MAG: hypothetical protein ABIT10_00085 [Alteraurantiacibacter sp.]